MMIRKLSLLSILFISLHSCVEEPDPTNAREDFLGNWTCNEYEGDFAPQTYDVEFYAIGSGSTVGIRGLYGQGVNFVIEGEVNGQSVFISTQTVGGITIAGSGTLSNSYDRIEMTFSADDGGGVDNVKATLLR